MSYATIRALIESTIATAYAPTPVMFDAVQETPPDGEHVVLAISYPSVVMPTLCVAESGIELVRGNVQISCYAPRGRGMKRLEELSQIGMQALVTLQAQPDPNGVRPRVGEVTSATVLSGDQPYALITVSAPFTAKG